MKKGKCMLHLIKNEWIKIVKRKNIYVLLGIAFFIVIIFNFHQKLTMPYSSTDILKLYQRAYDTDNALLEKSEDLYIEEYKEVLTRVKLEEYAIQNAIPYNILNSENQKVSFPIDARSLFLKTLDNFEIIIICILIYLASITIGEELNSGTIKYLLMKPHSRIGILASKIITNIMLICFIAAFILLLQYILGGILFGFDSYQQDFVTYDWNIKEIKTENLIEHTIMVYLARIPFYIILTMIGMLFGTMISNIAVNIVITLGMYSIISSIKNVLNNWDIGWYFVPSDRMTICQITIVSLCILFLLLAIRFKTKDIKNV